MQSLSSFAPHLGAALGAALMLAAGLAFQAGRGSESAAALEPGSLEAGPWIQVAADTSPVVETSPGVAPVHAQPVGSLPPVTPDRAHRPHLAVIVDDVADPATLAALLDLDIPLTVSILPYAEAAPQMARLARAAGRDVFVHLPMEPVGLDDPGPHALIQGLSDRQIQARLSWAFARVPGAMGFNNHMGSRLTSDWDHMEQVFTHLPSTHLDLVFVDSLTSPTSVAGDMARRAGLKSLSRDVFLDHEPDAEAIEQQIAQAFAQARDAGFAIAIIHPRPVSLAALANLDAKAQAAGVDLVGMAQLVAADEERS